MAGIAEVVTTDKVEAHLIGRPPGILSDNDDTAEQFDDIVTGIVSEVTPYLGGATTGTKRWNLAVWAASMGTAAYIESALWPEQQGPGELGRAEFLMRRYMALLDRLRGWIGGPDDDQDGDEDSPSVAKPRGKFPPAIPYPDPVICYPPSESV